MKIYYLIPLVFLSACSTTPKLTLRPQQPPAATDTTGTRYPEVLFTTSTRDDRVHPAHARKMAARMREQGHPVLYYENLEGGHGGAADNPQRAHLQALEISFLWRRLGTGA